MNNRIKGKYFVNVTQTLLRKEMKKQENGINESESEEKKIRELRNLECQ